MKHETSPSTAAAVFGAIGLIIIIIAFMMFSDTGGEITASNVSSGIAEGLKSLFLFKFLFS